MKNELKNIENINVFDTDFEDENDGIIIVKAFGNIKIGLGVSQRHNGDAELWLDVDEAQQLISALETAIKEIKTH